MAGVRLQWAKFGKVDSFNVYRSDSPFDLSTIPAALATDVLQCEYWDASAKKNSNYFYTVASVTNGIIAYSDEYVSLFTSNNDFVFVTNDGYVAPSGLNVNFTW